MNMLSRFFLFLLLLSFAFPSLGQQTAATFSSAFFEKQVFAHRGGHSFGVENSLQTILNALNANTQAIEIDVRLSKDKQLVLFHDETIERVLDCDKALKISELSLQELKSYNIRNTNEKISTLAELVDTLSHILPNRKEGFLLELDFKPHGEDLEPALDQLDAMIKRELEEFGEGIFSVFFVSSFYPDVLKELKKRFPKLKTSLAIMESPPSSKFLARIAVLMAGRLAKSCKVEIIEPSLCLVTKSFVKRWHKRGYLILAYTANRACEQEYLSKMGVAYTSNCPRGDCENEKSDAMGKPKRWCKDCER